VGEKNSTPEELDAYMLGYKRRWRAGDYAGLSKISVQTGTSHGGIVLPDGTHRQGGGGLRHAQGARRQRTREHGAGGAVQHGASTLPEDFFNKFPEVQTLEIHLATGFMNLFLDHPPSRPS
jgi:hypothetical protein